MAITGKEIATAGNIKAAFAKLLGDTKLAQRLRRNMGLGDTLGPLPVEFGGTGATGEIDMLSSMLDRVERAKPSHTAPVTHFATVDLTKPYVDVGSGSDTCFVHFWGEPSLDSGKYISFAFFDGSSDYTAPNPSAVKVAGFLKDGSKADFTFDFRQKVSNSAAAHFDPLMFSFVEDAATNRFFVFGRYTGSGTSTIPVLRSFTMTNEGVMTFDETNVTGVPAETVGKIFGNSQGDVGIFPVVADVLKGADGTARNAMVVSGYRDGVEGDSSALFVDIDKNGVMTHKTVPIEGFALRSTGTVSSETLDGRELFATMGDSYSRKNLLFAVDLEAKTISKITDVDRFPSAGAAVGSLDGCFWDVLDENANIVNKKISPAYRLVLDLDTRKITPFGQRWFTMPRCTSLAFPTVGADGEITCICQSEDSKTVTYVSKNISVPLYTTDKMTATKYSPPSTRPSSDGAVSGSVKNAGTRSTVFIRHRMTVCVSTWKVMKNDSAL